MTIGQRSADRKCVHGEPGHCPICDGVACSSCDAGYPRADGAPWVHITPQGERLCENLHAINAAAGRIPPESAS